MVTVRMVRWLAIAAFPAAIAAQETDPAKATGFRKELVTQFADLQTRFVALAKAFPQAKYNWRPAPDARTVSEMFMHAVVTNVSTPAIAGVRGPANIRLKADAEQTEIDLAKITDLLKKSFDYAQTAVMLVSDAQMDRMVDVLGKPAPKRAVLELTLTRAKENLEQAISYARANGIALPLSQ
jgi:hypothetical protein